MPGAPQAKFEFVATGDDQVNAQIQGVIDKLVNMKSAATEAGKASSEGMLSAKEDVRAVGEALGTSIPRPLANIISQFQSLQGVLAGAGIGGALLLGAETAEKLFEKGQEIYDKWLNVDKAVEEYNKQLGEAVTKSAQNALSIEDAESNLTAATDAMNKFAAARMKALERSEHPQSSLDLALGKSEEKADLSDQLKKQLEVWEDRKTVIEQMYTQTVNLINAQKQLNDITLQGTAKINADKETANQLADAQLKKTQDLAAVINEARRQYNAKDPAHAVPLVADDVGQLEHSISLYYSQADAFARIQAAAREAQTTIQSFNDMLAAANRRASTSEQDDPYQKQLQETDDLWNKIIDDTEKGAAEKFKVLQQDGIDTTTYITKLNATVLNLLQARYKAEIDLQKKQQQELLSGGLKAPGLDQIGVLTVGPQEEKDKEAAKTLIEQITADLKDEAAQEQVLKDQAMQAGLSQLTVETELLALRGESADKIQVLVNQLKNLATAMHQGIGDPVILSQADRFGQKLDDLRLKSKTWSTELKKDFNQDLENAFTGIVSDTETVSQAFQKMGQSILEQLAKVIYQMYIVKLLQSALGGIFGGGGGGGGDIVDLSSVVNAPSAIPGAMNLIPHALGGPVFPGQTYLVGERGPELFRAGTSGSIVPNNQIGHSGMPPVQVNIHNYGQPMEQSQTSRFDGTQYIVDVVVKNIQSNGGIRQALKS